MLGGIPLGCETQLDTDEYFDLLVALFESYFDKACHLHYAALYAALYALLIYSVIARLLLRPILNPSPRSCSPNCIAALVIAPRVRPFAIIC